jgi:hypothetical protein
MIDSRLGRAPATRRFQSPSSRVSYDHRHTERVTDYSPATVPNR